ncbi:glycoside hydrolase family 24 protein [Oxalicibacterium faecigallinarum]|uniref:Lysozyme n=1 Tax=Oxalicibacterium faecigallinarum TaxID=573741 RepID=A0A8J3ANI4_9BURK|nr:glycoside hydrolase family 104 protein [Oxalicibacterium faecigallinarum]GGI16889.1 hypothetical protein GCM10008066_06220 [Oxalicibacterium faecigallinarum]
MNSAVKVAAATFVVGAAFYWMRTRQAAGDGGVVDTVQGIYVDVTETAAGAIDQITGGTMKLSAMANVTTADVQNSNVQAFLRVIRRGEGTSSENGYRMHFGGSLFSSFADHPRKVIKKSGYSSSAAGAYQFLTGTWDETARIMRLPDFSPASQDIGAVGRIAARGALDDVKAGRFTVALSKVAREWASMPGSPYGQPVITMATAAYVYAQAGGVSVG